MRLAITFVAVFLLAYGTALLTSAVVSAKGSATTRRATLGSGMVAASATLVSI